jgi:hypothetical protein
MNENEKSNLVAQKARETFIEIKRLRKTMPQFTRGQKDELNAKIKEAQDKWWEDVKPYMKGENERQPY